MKTYGVLFTLILPEILIGVRAEHDIERSSVSDGEESEIVQFFSSNFCNMVAL
jgi:hypothetical protein